MKITIRNVAEAAGVSAMAVSSVLHGTGKNVRVGDETAARIRKVAADLSYQPNTLARSLRFRQTNTIGVVFQHFSRLDDDNPYYPQLLNGIMTALFDENYTLALCPSLVQGDNPAGIWDGRFDGVLWARPDFTDSNVEKLRDSHVPLVMLHAPPGSAPGVPTFCIDNTRALRLVVDHLAGLGHVNIAFAVDQINQRTSEGRARCEAFLLAAERAVVGAELWFWDGTIHGVTEFFALHPEITAVAAFSDTLAGQLLKVCLELNIAVPGDLSVIGFDSSRFCEQTTPRLTSVQQRVEQIAFDAASHLISLIRSGQSGLARPTSTSSLYDCELNVRESTSSPSLKKHTNHEIL